MAEAWSTIAARYHLGKRSKLSAITCFLKHHPRYARALDIGTGTAALALAYKPRAFNWRYLEIDEEAAKKAAQTLGQLVETNWAAIESDHFDLITIIDTFFYFSNPQESINKINNLLNPKGQLLVTLTNGDNYLWINRLRNYLNLGQSVRGFAFEESKEVFLNRFDPLFWRLIYLKPFSYPLEEIILLIIDWLDQKLSDQKRDKNKVDKLTKVEGAKGWETRLMQLTWPLLKLVSLLDYPFRPFLQGYRFVAVFAKK